MFDQIKGPITYKENMFDQIQSYLFRFYFKSLIACFVTFLYSLLFTLFYSLFIIIYSINFTFFIPIFLHFYSNNGIFM